MSGDSPNTFTNENVFDFKEGRSSPAPTTSKDHNPSGYVTASVLVEPQKEKDKDKDKDKDKEDEDKPDFSSPILNNAEDKEKRRNSDADKTGDKNDQNYDGDKGDKNKEDQNLLNGGLDRLPKPYANSKDYGEEESEDDTCIVNCIYYTMECCRCSIV